MNAANPIRAERNIAWLRGFVVLAMAGSLAWAVAGTIHWPILGDAPLLHYACFLMDHGKVPYRDVVDIEMPGTYALEWSAIHLLGPGALAWRFFDFGLLLVIGAAMLVIAAPVDWLASGFAGTMFALIHLRDGPTHTGQRDLMMTAMLLPACALLLWWHRGAATPTHAEDEAGVIDWASAGLVASGALLGMATLIKPDGVIFAVGLAGMLVLLLRRLRRPWGWSVMLMVSGYALPLLAAAVWLWRHGALAAFVATCRGLVPYHASLGRPSLGALVVGSFPSVLLAVTLPAIPVYWVLRPWRRWEGAVLSAVTALGAVHYILQGKGFPYHRYPAEAFLLLLCALVLFSALQRRDWVRWPALLGVVLGAGFLAPVSAQIACHYDWRNQEFNRSLEADLTRLGGPALQERVQCVDMTSGCLNTLYNMQMMPATGYLLDCYLFQPVQTPVSEAYRAGFWRAIEEARPAVMVVSDQECFSMARSWALPQRWPQFAAMLQNDYILERQYTPPNRVGWWRKPSEPYSYRLYVRKQP